METAAERRSGTTRQLVTDPRLLAVLFSTSMGILVHQGIPPALPAIGSTFGVSDAHIGLVMTAFLLPTSLSVPVTGALADAYGRRPVLLVSLVAFGLAGIAASAVGSFTTLLALRVVQGVAFSGITPLSIAVLGDLYDGSTGATAQGLRVSSHGVATTIAPALAGFLAGIFWGYPFLLYGLAFPAALLVYVYLPETAPEVAGDGAADSDGAADPNPDASADSNAAGRLRNLADYLRELAGEFRSPTLVVLVLGIGALFFVRYAVITFVPLFAVRQFGTSTLVGGLLLSAFGATRTLAAPLTGSLNARLSRRLTLFASLACVTAGLALVGVATGVPWLAGAVVLFSVGDGLATPFFHDSISALASAARRGGVVSVMNSCKTGSASLSPAAFGLVLAAAGFQSVFLGAAALTVLYAAVAAVALRGRGDVLAALDSA